MDFQHSQCIVRQVRVIPILMTQEQCYTWLLIAVYKGSKIALDDALH